jgi:hypothetical protein
MKAPRFSSFQGHCVVLLVVLFVAVTVLMGILGHPMINDTNRSGILGFELAGSAARAGTILASWDAQARAAAQLQTLVDCFVYIPVYVFALSAWVAWVGVHSRWGWLRQIAFALAWAMWLAGALDYVENVAMLRQLGVGADQTLAGLARTCALGKFGIAYATSAVAVLGSVAVALQRGIARRSR